VVEYDAGTAFVQTWPRTPPLDGFNPHGISIDEAHNLMVISDFICPLRTLHVHSGSTADLRGSVKVWDLARREITKTIVVGDPARPAGTMEVQLIPRDQHLRAYTLAWPTTSSISSIRREEQRRPCSTSMSSRSRTFRPCRRSSA
jgi:selenium-binding protein 1